MNPPLSPIDLDFQAISSQGSIDALFFLSDPPGDPFRPLPLLWSPRFFVVRTSSFAPILRVFIFFSSSLGQWSSLFPPLTSCQRDPSGPFFLIPCYLLLIL